MTCGWGRRKGKVARCRGLDLVPISFRSRSASRSEFLLLLHFPCCDEWAVHSVICCRWCESWNEFSVCSTQCGHGLVKTWWCQRPVCWMSRAQCDLLSLVWELEWIFCVFYTVCAWFGLRLGDVSGRCAEWAVHSVICCRWCESWNEFSVCATQCAHGLVKTWWC